MIFSLAKLVFGGKEIIIYINGLCSYLRCYFIY